MINFLKNSVTYNSIIAIALSDATRISYFDADDNAFMESLGAHGNCSISSIGSTVTTLN